MIFVDNHKEDADGLQDVSEQDEHNISSDGLPSEHECTDNVQATAPGAATIRGVRINQ